MPQPIILLASASPRRRELMRLLNVPYEVLSTDIDETPRPGETIAAMVERLSHAKATAARAAQPEALVIACDTSVELDGVIYGKPRDAAEARTMLRALRGRDHLVCGGTTLSYGSDVQTIVVRTRVWMRDYADAEIEAYIATGDPLDKAAAYAVQHPTFHPVARVEGCFANVMGLALCHLYRALGRHYPPVEPCLKCQLHPDQDCTVQQLVEEGAIRNS